VEVLATLALVAIILPVAMSGISLALATAGESRWQAEATALAQTKMAEILASGDWADAALSGDFAPDRPEFRWESLVTNWQGDVQQLDVQVSWTHRGQVRSVLLTTLVYAGATP